MLITKQEASPKASAAQQVSDPWLSRQGGWEGIYCNVLSLNIVPQDKSSLSLPSSQQPQLLLSAPSLTRDDTVTGMVGSSPCASSLTCVKPTAPSRAPGRGGDPAESFFTLSHF